MFRKRTLSVPIPQQEVEHILSNQIRVILPRGNVSENHFTVYKSVASTFSNRNMRHRFRFSGEFQQAGTKTEIVYCVYPAFSFYVLICFLIIGLIETISLLLQQNDSLDSMLIAAGFVLVCIVSIVIWISQKNDCVRNFETLLTTDKQKL